MSQKFLPGDIVMLISDKVPLLSELGIKKESLGVVRAGQYVNPQLYEEFVKRVGRGVAQSDFVYVEWCDNSDADGFFAKYRFLVIGRKCSCSVAQLHTN